MNLLPEFQFTSVSGSIDPLGPLASLIGTWRGGGVNQIWRPFFGTQDRFLELNETLEVLEFTAIPGDIPNRGLLQADINLRGVRYLQQIQDVHVLGPNGYPAGIHIEPGLWLSVPATTDPANRMTVARLATIPHGTSFVAQGTSFVLPGPVNFPPVSIDPFPIGNPSGAVPFPEQNLAVPTPFRTPAGDIPNVTQALVNDPNHFLLMGVAGRTVTSTTVLDVSTVPLNPPASGGGADGIAFLVGAASGPNAAPAQVDATFWIETIDEGGGQTRLQLQYSQRVLLNFSGLSWPHVSVATLQKL